VDFRRTLRGPAIVVAVVAYSWVAAGRRPFTLAQELLVAFPAVLCLAAATLTPGTVRADASGRSWRGSAAVWLGLFAVMVAWELNAYFSSPRSAHPTLSVIADDVMSVQPGRALVFVLWLASGWVLVRRPRAVHP
jgi:hypothetical protein